MVISCTASQITPQRHSGTLASRFSRLASEPGIHNPRRYGRCDLSERQDLWLWIPGSARGACARTARIADPSARDPRNDGGLIGVGVAVYDALALANSQALRGHSGKTHRRTARRNLSGATQDAEWAWTDGKLHSVQSRDITSRSPLFKRVSRERSTRPETIGRTRSRSPKNELSDGFRLRDRQLAEPYGDHGARIQGRRDRRHAWTQRCD
jgi:hypothetical protein